VEYASEKFYGDGCREEEERSCEPDETWQGECPAAITATAPVGDDGEW
jgi:hypothetical protein